MLIRFMFLSQEHPSSDIIALPTYDTDEVITNLAAAGDEHGTCLYWLVPFHIRHSCCLLCTVCRAHQDKALCTRSVTLSKSWVLTSVHCIVGRDIFTRGFSQAFHLHHNFPTKHKNKQTNERTNNKNKKAGRPLCHHTVGLVLDTCEIVARTQGDHRTLLYSRFYNLAYWVVWQWWLIF